MKKMIALVLVLVMALSMVACGGKGAASNKTPLAGTMEENVMKIIERCPVEFMGGTMPVDLADTSEDGLWALTYFTGLADASKITDVAVYEPMMGSMAFSLVMVRVADAANAKAVAEEMKAGIDTRKWICVEANEVMVAGYSDTVMFIMLDSQLGLKAQNFVDAFTGLCGADLDFTI